MDDIVTAAWLADRMTDDSLVVLEAGLRSPMATASSAISGCIPGARYADLDVELSDPGSGLPHTMLSPEDLTREMRRLGVNGNDTVVVYDRFGLYASPRLWLMLRSMGHRRAFVLEGGLVAWIGEGLATSSSYVVSPPTGDFVASPLPNVWYGAEDVLGRFRNRIASSSTRGQKPVS